MKKEFDRDKMYIDKKKGIINRNYLKGYHIRNNNPSVRAGKNTGTIMGFNIGGVGGDKTSNPGIFYVSVKLDAGGYSRWTLRPETYSYWEFLDENNNVIKNSAYAKFLRNNYEKNLDIIEVNRIYQGK